MGEAAWTSGAGVAPFVETSRDTHTFSRRSGDLPKQAEGDVYDMRSVLHRDGTVFSVVSVADLQQPEVRCMRRHGILKFELCIFGSYTCVRNDKGVRSSVRNNKPPGDGSCADQA